MGKMYTVSFSETAVTAQVDLWEVNVSSTRMCVIHGFELANSSDVGDAAEEILPIVLRRGNATSGSGGSAVTPAPLEEGQGAANFTAETCNTTKASTGSPVTLGATGWNIRMSPSQWIWSPEMRIYLAPSSRFCIEITNTPADSIDISGTLWVEELG